MERKKKAQSRVKYGWIKTFMKWNGYIMIFGMITGAIFPMVVVNYVKDQIRKGDWVNVDPEQKMQEEEDPKKEKVFD
jgi:hypothetical protein